MVMCICNGNSPILFGLGFLEKEPKRFECQYIDPDTGEAVWKECKKVEICEENYPKDQYRPDRSDEEYIYNWVEKYDMLCEPKWKVGLLGTMYFVGVLTTLTFVPYLSDRFGRKWVLNTTMMVSILA